MDLSTLLCHFIILAACDIGKEFFAMYCSVKVPNLTKKKLTNNNKKIKVPLHKLKTAAVLGE